MKSFYCQGGFVRVEEIGVPHRTEFEPPIFIGTELRAEISRRRTRSRAIREQNRRAGHE